MNLKISTFFYWKFGADPGSSVPVGIGGLKLLPVRFQINGPYGRISDRQQFTFDQMCAYRCPLAYIGIEKAEKSKELLYY